MITVQAPVTVNQFDEQRYARIEADLHSARMEVAEMKALLLEVLRDRQALIDHVQQRLDTTSSALKTVVEAVTLQTHVPSTSADTEKEG